MICPKINSLCLKSGCVYWLELFRNGPDGKPTLDENNEPIKDGNCIKVWEVLLKLEKK